MDVRYITVLSDMLHTIPVVDGQLIAVEDIDMYLYDMGGKRRTTSGQLHVDSLPEIGQPKMVYVLTTDTPNESGMYVWIDDKFVRIADANTNVTTKPDKTTTKVYITGTPVGDKSTEGHLNVCKDIYFNAKTGEVTAKKFLGGSAATSDKATSDSRGQQIDTTYIKDIQVNDREITFTKGDDTPQKFTVGNIATASVPGVVKSGTDISVDADGNVSVVDNSHKHKVANISDLKASATELNYVKGVTSSVQSQLDSKVPQTTKVNGYALSGDVTLDYEDVGADAEGTAQIKVSAHNTSSTSHQDIRELIADLNKRLNAFLDSGDVDLDQLSEIIAYIDSNKELIDDVTTNKVNVNDIINNMESTSTNKPLAANIGRELKALIDALTTVVSKKAESSTVTAHTGNTTVHITPAERTNWNDANSKKHTHTNKSILDATTASYTEEMQTKLSGIATGAEVNQNAFSIVKVGSTSVAADSKTDTLTLAGSNVTITPDATNDKITFGITKANVTNALGYTPTTVNIRSGLDAPDDSVGVDGDIYIQILND